MQWRRFAKTGFVIVIAFVTLNLILAFHLRRTQESTTEEYISGAHALELLAKDINVSLDVSKLTQSAEIRESGNCRHDLSAAAVQFGLEVIERKMSIKELVHIQHPVIAHVKSDSAKPNHFVVIRVLGEMICIIEPNEEFRFLTRREFSRIWRGHILFVSKSDIKPPTESPRIDCDQPVYDFGQEENLKTIEHTFVIRNSGQRELKIDRVEAQCSCTATLLSKHTVPPGGIAQIKMQFMTEFRHGRQVAWVTVYSNAPDRPVLKLTMTGVVAGLLEVTPPNIHLGSIRNASEIEKTIRISDPGHGRLKIKNIETTAPYIKAVLRPSKKERIAAEVILTISPKMPMGKLREKVIITSNEPKYPIMEVLIEGEVIGNLDLVPDQIFFGVVKPDTTVKRVLRMIDYTAGGIEISKIESLSPYISTTTNRSSQTANTVDIEFSFKAPAAKKGIVADGVRIYTTDDKEPMIEVPLYAIVE